MNREELLAAIALTQLPYINFAARHELYRRCGSAAALLRDSKEILSVFPDLAPKVAQTLQRHDEALHKAEVELTWCEAHGVQVIPMNSPSYPQRLVDCPDAPVVLYYKGSGDLNHKKIISIVGTRRCTPYGRDILRHMMQDMKAYADVLVISGLAYGIDITAHREALANGFPTVAVLAHGLDMIYPSSHRDTAIAMLEQGGLLTECTSQTPIGKSNFVQRNRLVAGLADCAILVESGAKGGGLITLSIAQSYNRDTFAFPGPVTAEYSKGCNNLIRDNGAALITCAEDLVRAMGWTDDEQLATARQQGIERRLFNDLSAEEQALVAVLQKTNDLQANILTIQAGLPINTVLATMFSLEMKGVVKTLAGGIYHLL